MMQPHQSSSIGFLLLFSALPFLLLLINDRFCLRQFGTAYRRYRPWLWLLSLLALGMVLVPRGLRLSATDLTPLLRTLTDIAYVYILGQAFLFLLFGGFLLFSWLARRILSRQNIRQVGGQRRKLLGCAAGVIPLVAFGLAADGVYESEHTLLLLRHQVALPHLPPALSNFKIAQITDAHLGPFFTLDRLEEAFRLVRQEKPDLLVITGDLVDDLDLLRPAMEKIDALSAEIPQGILFCWGNHEYFRNKPLIEDAIRKSKMVLLENENILLFNGSQPVYIAAVDYPWAKNTAEQETVRRDYFAQAMDGIPAEAFTIFLAHHPDFLFNSFAAGLPLALCGHTHGGQIGLFGKSFLPFQYRYMRGWYEENGSRGYVSCGTGQWLPFRLGCPAEVTVFTLTEA